MKSLGNFIAQKRIASGYRSQRSLASKINVSSATISRIEAGLQRPNPGTLKDIATHLHNTSYEELMAVAGYWNNEENPEHVATKSSNTNERNSGNLELSKDGPLAGYQLELDGEKIIGREVKNVIEYLRQIRAVESKMNMKTYQDWAEEVVNQYGTVGAKKMISQLEKQIKIAENKEG